MCKLHDVKTQIQHRQIRKPMLLIPECDNAGSCEAGQPEILNKWCWQLLAANVVLSCLCCIWNLWTRYKHMCGDWVWTKQSQLRFFIHLLLLKWGRFLHLFISLPSQRADFYIAPLPLGPWWELKGDDGYPHRPPHAPYKLDLYFSTNTHDDPAISYLCKKLGKYCINAIKFSLCLESEKIKQLEL